jgi:hypothetical protein
MKEDTTLLELLKRLPIILPLLALPFAPAIGKAGADFVLFVSSL